ncbi:MAG TPA: DNA polymerase I [Aggregatilineaceae bacterium]|nr:DNA polymerase I [Aggregatilineaceae bacterium]
MARPTLVLIDGHALAYRQFFALPIESFTTRGGEPTNATFGFARTLLDILDKNPDYLAVSFDQGLTGRDALYDEYKGTRDKMPNELRVQLDRIRELVQAFNIPILELEGYEADDVIGSVSPQAEAQGVDVMIITGDRDLLQLLTDHTQVQLPGKTLGDAKVYDLARFREEYGLEPRQLPELKGLMGDASDNIPGIKGVGEKTASKLIAEYGSVAGVYEHLGEIKGALRAKLEAGRDSAFLSTDLATIRRDVPVQIDLSKCVAHDYRYEDVEGLFRVLEFRLLIRRLPGRTAVAASGSGQQLTMFAASEPSEATSEQVEIVVPYTVVDDEAKLAALVERLARAEAIAFDTESTSTDQMLADLVGISLAVDGDEGYYIPVGHIAPNAPPRPAEQAQPDLVDGHTPQQLPLDRVIAALRPALTDPQIPKYGHNAPYDLVLLRRYGIDVQPITFDTMVGEWVCDPGSRNLGLKNLAWVRLGVQMTEITDLIGSGRAQITMDRVPVERAAPYAAADAVLTYRLVETLRPELEEKQAWRLFSEIEMPLIPVIADMDMAGVLLDVAFLRELSDDLNARLRTLEQEIEALSDGYGPFNPGSPKQLNEVLFDHLKLATDGLRKTSHGFSTAADVLDGLRGEHPIVDKVMTWRELQKLQSTYVDALPMLVNPHTGRVHTSFNQTGTSTGRVSSSNPNLQNIPIRTEEGRRVRRAFIAPAGRRLLSVDYSQVELRILAHYSQDAALLRAFREGQDIHRATAAAVYHVPLEAVTYEQRSFAKSVNFGLMYGMGAFRLARDSELTLAEAEAFIASYFQQFPGVRQYLNASLARARQQGYVETLLGRRRYFPILHEKGPVQASFQARQRAEREAINMPIQGTAADIIKIAMIHLARALDEGKYKARLILQVHDELVLEVPEDEIDAVAPLTVEVMEAAWMLDAPLVADARTGPNWAEMTPYRA